MVRPAGPPAARGGRPAYGPPGLPGPVAGVRPACRAGVRRPATLLEAPRRDPLARRGGRVAGARPRPPAGRRPPRRGANGGTEPSLRPRQEIGPVREARLHASAARKPAAEGLRGLFALSPPRILRRGGADQGAVVIRVQRPGANGN